MSPKFKFFITMTNIKIKKGISLNVQMQKQKFPVLVIFICFYNVQTIIFLLAKVKR